MTHRNLQRCLILCAALAFGLGMWATVAADEETEAEEPELEVVWSAELTVGSVLAGTPLPAPYTSLRDVHGFSSFVTTGSLTPDSFDLRGRTVSVLALAVVGSGTESSLRLTLNAELPQDFRLKIAEQTFAFSVAGRPAGLAEGYLWDDVDLSWATGRTITVELARPYPPLTLELSSSRELCTANTLTELTWKIAGGKPPYTLTIEGESVDPEAESHRANCGPLTIDPQTEEPLPNPTKTFSAVVKDSQMDAAAAPASVSVALKPPLASAIDLEAYGYRYSAWVRWDHSPELTDAEMQHVLYLVRTRLADATGWTYNSDFSGFPFDDQRLWTNRDDIEEGSHYEISVAAIRHELEKETPEALQWTEPESFFTITDIQNIEVSSTYSTITVSWDTQPGGRSYWVRAQNGQGSRRASHVVEGPARTEALITKLWPDTEYRVDVTVDLADNPTAAVYDIPIRTKPAPPDYHPPTSGPVNLQVSQTSNSIRATWGLPYEGATMLFRVELRDPDSRRRIGPPRLIEETTFTYYGLQPSTRYEVEIVHMGTVIRAARQVVTTEPEESSGTGARSPIAQGLPPFAAPPPSFSWPVQPGASHEMTADPWIWRGPDLGPRYHIGLDIGTPVGAPVHAAEAGMLRVANEREANTGYVLYCPDRGPLSLRPPLHQQIEYSTASSRSSDGRLACMYIVSAASGRTALIFHDDGQHVTKYSHLASFSDKIQRSLAVDWRAPIRVAEGEQIGLSGASADRDEYGTDPHLHFEIRYLYGTVSPDWYRDERSFAFCDPIGILKQSVQRPNYGSVTRGYCGWHEQRYMDTVRDPEEYLPPLPPESDKPPGERAFELASVDAVGSANSPALRLSLSVSIERPAFYDYWDYEWVAPEENGTARVLLPGLQRSRPNLTGFRILQDDGCREPDGTGALDDLSLLTQDVDRHQVSVPGEQRRRRARLPWPVAMS